MSNDLLKSLFEEFKYRHELFWKLLAGLSAVILTLNVLPFLKDGGPYEMKELKSLLFMFPFVAACITIAGTVLLLLEYRLVAHVEITYNAQKGGIDSSTPNIRVLDHRWIGYLVVLCWGAGLAVLSTLEALELFARLRS